MENGSAAKNETVKELLLNCIDVDANGNATFRLYKSIGTNVDYAGCTKAGVNIMDLLKELFAFNSNEKTSVRITFDSGALEQFYILQENGDKLLTEDSDNLIQ